MTTDSDNGLVALLTELHGLCFSEPWTSEAFEALLQSPGVRPVVISDEDEPAGMALLRVVADEAEILTLGVIPLARRTGLGRALVQTLEALAREQGAHQLFLEVSSHNEAAQQLYSRCQFTPSGCRKDYYADGTDALLLSKTLL